MYILYIYKPFNITYDQHLKQSLILRVASIDLPGMDIHPEEDRSG